MPSLYERIGGEEAIEAAVELFYLKILADNRINSFFKDTDFKKQIKKQKDFLCFALGGPNGYTWDGLRSSHSKLVKDGLNDGHFNNVIEHLITTLSELGVNEAEAKEVRAIVDSVRDHVLGR